MYQALCQRWGYTPEQVEHAPTWVLRMTNLLAAEEAMRAEAAG